MRRMSKDTVDFWSINSYVRDLIDARKASTWGERFIFKKMQMIPRDFSLEEFLTPVIVLIQQSTSRLTG